MKPRLSIPIAKRLVLDGRSDFRKPAHQWLDQLDQMMRQQGKQEVVRPAPILPPALQAWVERLVWAAPAAPA
ncbi:MAG: hypothetical protein NHB36_05185 [Nitrospira sp.]|nr:hypothetical protein [Nitrospira sp.]